MAMPIQREMEIPLLLAIYQAGGQIEPSQAYKALTNRYAGQLTEEDLSAELKDGGMSGRIAFVLPDSTSLRVVT